MLASKTNVLTDSDRERLHAAALDVLEKAGVCVEESRLRAQLGKRGASVTAGDRVRIPRELVGECLDSVHRSPVMRCVNGKVLQHRAADRYYHSLVTDPYIIDYREGIRRPRLCLRRWQERDRGSEMGRYAVQLGDAGRLSGSGLRLTWGPWRGAPGDRSPCPPVQQRGDGGDRIPWRNR